MKRLYVLIYVCTAVLAGLSYWHIYPWMIDTVIMTIVVSNLTVNYIMGSMIFGGSAGWGGYEFFKNCNLIVKFGGALVFALFAALLWLLIMTTIGGYQLR